MRFYNAIEIKYFIDVLVFIQGISSSAVTWEEDHRILRYLYSKIDMHRPKVNISWGLNDKSNTKP